MSTKEEFKIKIRSLYKSFANHKVLDGIDLDVKKGSSLVILGASGSGKSVLIKNIVGLIKPDKGQIFIDNLEIQDISNKLKFEIMKGVGFLFQGGALFDSLNVRDNITFDTKKLSKKEKNDLAGAKLNSVGLSTRILELYPSELSGGMQKRVALARAICNTPSILFLDEPTTGLDPIMANVINELIIKIQEELCATTITITHDMISTEKIAKEIAMIYHGKVQWYGSKEEMRNSDNPYLKQFINGLTTGPIEV
ncbi:ABC transporter ATP-binding protein [Rickettsia typhi]|uniref:Ribonucleotide ABC transporter ATP-binding protein n=2 Tax=Rickettsia typhi TaxID=785 RepID=Q68XW5_RICTY|nr:ABC transporter ATP-binding protein [Rickettsia typhi]AAU03527.1 ribonucleotide ABC transporter ATP-binding protein [Rickettsia typhi str. Wilmington]AFE53904.1 ribonucleotide ABC transporter ATP-binding protein [Rickettsia typhi str. TH1527]AFE54742.1 ribonucleotide ABC transporter ATP-binding protein [Rickettsia typhi str. B9991CWPP]